MLLSPRWWQWNSRLQNITSGDVTVATSIFYTRGSTTKMPIPPSWTWSIFGNTNIKKHPSIYRSKSMFFSMFRLWSWTLHGELEDPVTPHWDKYICKHVLNVCYTTITLYADMWQDPTSGTTPSALMISSASLNSHPVSILYVFPLITSWGQIGYASHFSYYCRKCSDMRVIQ